MKDPKKPIMPEDWRFELVKNVKCVDYVLNQKTYDPSPVLKSLAKRGIKVDILTKGDDMYQIKGIDTIKKLGGRFITPPYTAGYSTSDLVKKILNRYAEVKNMPNKDGKGPRVRSPRPSVKKGGRKKGKC